MVMLSRDVSIDNPCRVDWSSMTKREASRRFCGECKKHVHDLSAMTENEARALLSGPTTEGLCVRTFTDARGELVFRPDVPVSRLFRSATSVAALRAMAVVAPLSLTACMGARQFEPPANAAPQHYVEPARPPAQPSPSASTAPPPVTTVKAAR